MALCALLTPVLSCGDSNSTGPTPVPPSMTTDSLANGIVGTGYSQTLTATGGDGSYTWSISVGTLPSGLSLNFLWGVVSGTPTAEGTSNFTVQVTSGDAKTASKDLSITVHAVVSVTTTSLADGVVGTAYSQTLAAAGGDGSYTWGVAAGSLPEGLSLSSGGVLFGSPMTEGTSEFTVLVTSGDLQTATQSLSITVYPLLAVTTSAVPSGLIGADFSHQLTAIGGHGTHSWSITAGSLPSGLSVNTGGLIFGTPSHSPSSR